MPVVKPKAADRSVLSIVHAIFDLSPDAIALFTADGKPIEFNQQMKNWFPAVLDRTRENELAEILEAHLKPALVQKIIKSGAFLAPLLETLDIKHSSMSYMQIQVSELDASGKKQKLVILRDYTDFHRNLKSMESGMREIERKKFDYEQKTQELEKAYRELEKMKANVQEADRIKSEFLSNMSHELRTPLNSIMALSSILLARMDGDLNEEQEKQIKIVEKSGKNLLNLINDILDLSKIDAGRMDVYLSEYSVPEFANSIRMTIQPMLRDSELEFQMHIDDEIDMHFTDENKLKQILLNLLTNGIKFTSKGHVKLGIYRTKFADVLEFIVSDTGIGIDPVNFETIFDPFRQIDGSATRKFGGTGLGLAVTKKMVELLGGKIWVESELGKGSTFKFILPAGKRTAGQKVMTEVEIQSMIESEKGTPEALLETEPSLEPGKKTILVVEDDNESLYIVKKYLADTEFQVVSLKEGSQVVSKTIQYKPDVILLDVMLPKKDGWEILQELKGVKETRDTPVMIVSMIDNKKLGFSLGASDYMVKPVAKDMLIKRLQKLSEEKGLKKILIVDDDLSQAELVEEILESDDFISEVATSGEMAIQLVKRKSYDLVILDLLMPQIDGFSVLKSLQGNPSTEKTPVLILTGKLLTKEDQQKLSGTYYHIFQKSMFSREKLLEQIHTILRTAQ
ncbi:MAG: response regulator [Bacteroidetes bacterium]|nr:response regulator [Bacteroidota bacterium]